MYECEKYFCIGHPETIKYYFNLNLKDGETFIFTDTNMILLAKENYIKNEIYCIPKNMNINDDGYFPYIPNTSDKLIGKSGICQDCGCDYGEWRFDPYDEELYGQEHLVCICDACYETSCKDI